MSGHVSTGQGAGANCDNKRSNGISGEEGGFLVEEGFSCGLWAGDCSGQL
jgi:hypothetical protein